MYYNEKLLYCQVVHGILAARAYFQHRDIHYTGGVSLSYRIQYSVDTHFCEKISVFSGRFFAMWAGFLLLFVFLLRFFYPEGTELLQEAFLPGDPEVTEQALRTMIHSLRCGEDLREAVIAFCRDILDHGKALY